MKEVQQDGIFDFFLIEGIVKFDFGTAQLNAMFCNLTSIRHISFRTKRFLTKK
jgi:hypothetical protein